jgi:hypothetical protein
VTDSEDKEATAKVFDKLATMGPDKAAKIILKGVTKNQARVLVGLDAHALHAFAKFSGSRYQDLVALSAGRALKATKKKH